ncbi:Polyisoprenoid-binding protein YceI [Epibacterium ulvae]|uniref:Polyisoprenoid-binding protein YceI n=1 Tax=Epibacterium ulvae TaxID=1156985 RepID=A0A1G5PZR6_9RHOB|nr:YceI family protein [Epibacterium ulvae]SCZ54898.1 Polyisoprenoid-binding protein YceI [Epibacterium ulvae]
MIIQRFYLTFLAPALLWFVSMTLAVQAAPLSYTLDDAKSEVGFTYSLGGSATGGMMPVETAQLQIDVRDIRNSDIDVTLNARRAKAGLFVATEAMRGPQVLHAKQFPTIRFQTRKITGDLQNAQVAGDLTIRNVTRPVTLQARLFRKREADLGDLSELEVLLTGDIDRREFGASGFPDLVGPVISLRIRARMTRSE